MPLSSLLLYFLSLGVVVSACWMALGLVKNYRLHFLSSYLGYLMAINIVWFQNSVVTGLAADVLKNIPLERRETVFILFGLGIFPLLAVAYHFLISFVAGILDEKAAPAVMIGHATVWAALFGLFLVRIQFVLNRKIFPLSLLQNMALAAVIILVPAAAFGYLLLRTSRQSKPEGKKEMIVFAGASLAAYLLFSAASLFLLSAPFLQWGVPLALFLANFIPVVCLGRKHSPTRKWTASATISSSRKGNGRSWICCSRARATRRSSGSSSFPPIRSATIFTTSTRNSTSPAGFNS
jgi:hypothetical protein